MGLEVTGQGVRILQVVHLIELGIELIDPLARFDVNQRPGGIENVRHSCQHFLVQAAGNNRVNGRAHGLVDAVRVVGFDEAGVADGGC